MNKKIKRSPLFYVGDKYKLMGQIVELFPLNIETFYEPFVGGGTVFLNVEAKKYRLNDLDKNLISIHEYLIQHSNKKDKFFSDVEKIIFKYNLSRSFKEDIIPDDLKNKWKKTYFAKFNKINYSLLRKDFNSLSIPDPFMLYLLLIYGFNRMLRFNKEGNFNIPVGNVDFNKNVVSALNEYFDITKNRSIIFSSNDFIFFIKDNAYKKNDFIYFDPPYLITFSEYNKFWNITREKELLDALDNLNKRGVRFALSNVTHYKGRINNLLIEWAKKYRIHEIDSNYISYHNNSKKNIKEVLVTNY